MKKNLQKTTDQLTYDAHFRELCFFRIAPVFGGLFIVYIALLGVNLSNVLERTHTLSTINSFRRDHAETEREYLSIVEGLDREEAQSVFGLTEITEVYFATESTFAVNSRALSHNVR